MHIEKLQLHNFRNYRFEDFEFAPGLNVIEGDNAQGKTNLLEAVYYLAAAQSFRARRDAEMVLWNEQKAVVEGVIRLSDRTAVLRAELSVTARRALFVNGVREKTAAEFGGRLKAVLFVPNDLSLVGDGASARRRFVDSLLCQLRPRYADAVVRYARLHEQKTRILRDYADDKAMLSSLDAFNEQIAVTGACIISFRARFCERLAVLASDLHRDISGGAEHMEVRYKTVSTVRNPLADEREIADAIHEHMRTHRAAEFAARQALSGPHKDDLEISIGGVSARTYASQGQRRTAALSLKLAGRELMRQVSGEQPVLLLDDVLSELDDGRRDWVLSRAAADGGQVIITMCDRTLLDAAGFPCRRLTVENGMLRG